VVEEDVDVGRRVVGGKKPAAGGERAGADGADGDNQNTYPKTSIL